MAKLILETTHRGVHTYHKIDSLPVTLGRAFDNDIILPDLTISPHHMVIFQGDSEDSYKVQNLSDENGSILNKTKMNPSETVSVSLPSEIKLGDLKARLLAADMPVEETRVRQCSGFFCIFSSPIWSAVLLMATIGIFFLERYLITPVAKEPLYYLSNVLPSILTILGITIIISGISRLSTHRWELVPAVSIASLIFLVPQLFEYAGHFLNYLFTSNTPGDILKNMSSFLLIPALLAIYMVKTNHTKWIPAIGVAALVSSPVIAYQFSDLVDKLSLTSGFSETPGYNQTLSPIDTRLNQTISLDEFIKEADKDTSEQVHEMLLKAKKEKAKNNSG